MSEPLTAKTIRLYCDGELSDEQARQVEQRLGEDPSLRSLVDSERQLKEHVARVMAADGSPVPAGLAGRVRESGARGTTAAAGGTDVEPAVATASRAWWRGPIRANIFAVAACLVLVAGAVLFGILGPSIDSLRMRNLPDVATEAAAAVAGEHVLTTTMLPAVAAQARFHSRDEAQRGLASLLGTRLEIFDLGDLGYEFVAGDTCIVPQCEQGCHLVYRRVEGMPGLLSLHIVPDRGQITLGDNPFPTPLPLITDVIPEGPECQKDVLVWSYGGHTYLLVVCVGDDTRMVAQRMQETLQAGGRTPRR
jgi:anti-sigma factor RsiW